MEETKKEEEFKKKEDTNQEEKAKQVEDIKKEEELKKKEEAKKTEEAKKAQRPKYFEDYKSFKGKTFENNINAINSLLFGQGLKISEIPFFYKDEGDEKIYLSANLITIKPTLGNAEEEIICYPLSYSFIVFCYNGVLFYLDEKHHLNIFAFDRKNNSYTRFSFDKFASTNQKNNSALNKELTIENSGEILEKIEKMNLKKNLRENYMQLCDILTINFDVKLMKPKPINENLEFQTRNYKISIRNYKFEVDNIGMIREELNINKGKMPFKLGIASLSDYAKLSKSAQEKSPLVKNSFKSPIIYKNFDEDMIPKNQTVVCEIKAGFAYAELKKQLEERIFLINNCIFSEAEKPTYFIGIVNFKSIYVNEIPKVSNDDFEIKEKTLLISVVDYNYCGMDTSIEIRSDYILFKKMEEIESDVKEMKLKMEKIESNFEKYESNLEKFESNVEKKFKNLTEKIEESNNNILNLIKSLHPDKTILKLKNFKEEEKTSNKQ